jgi:hypothetical protein
MNEGTNNTKEFSSFYIAAGKAAIKYKLPHINQGKTLKFSGIFSFRPKLEDFLRHDDNATHIVFTYEQ